MCIRDSLETVGPEQPLGVDELSTDMEAFQNYSGVESDDQAVKIIDGHVRLGRLAEMDDHDALITFAGGHPVPNKFASIKRSSRTCPLSAG